jgi:anti-sigma-K factor RskA
MMSAEEHVIDLLPAYALDCLDETETILVSEHLALCPDCQAEWRAYQSTVDQLALAGPEAAPSPGLKARLMDCIQPSSQPAASSPTTLSWWRSLEIFVGRFGPGLVAAGLVLILLLGVSNFWLWQRLNQPKSIQPESAVMRTIPLPGTELIPLANGLIVISVDGEHGTLVVDGLPPLDEAHQYQLWLIEDDGQRQSGGVFSVDEEGYGALWVSSPAPLSDYTAVGITIEPAGGSPGPTGDKVMGGALR